MSAIRSQPPVTVHEKREEIPPLENGDRLTRYEFERRYERMGKVKKAELIEGVVYMSSPVRLKRHSQPHVILTTWLGYYLSKTPGLDSFGDNGTVRIDDDNEVQPDLFLLLPASAGGAARVDKHDYVNGPPDLVCEVASSSASIDLHDKFNIYRRNRVKEYLVWRTEDQAVDWFALRDGKYEPIQAGADGLLRSEQFPGLWLDAKALIAGNLPQLLKVVDQGVGSAEHVGFAARLKQAASQ